VKRHREILFNVWVPDFHRRSNGSEDEKTQVETEFTAVVQFSSVQAAKGEDGSLSERRSYVPKRTRGNGSLYRFLKAAVQQAMPSERENTQASLSPQRDKTARSMSKMSLRRSTSISEVFLNSVSSRKKEMIMKKLNKRAATTRRRQVLYLLK
jgi:hypothetical protein